MKLSSMDEDKESMLLESVKRLESDAIAEVFDVYAPLLYKYAMRLCQDPTLADNIVGDVFVRLMEQLSAGKGPNSNLKSYLYQITYHLIVDRSKYHQRMAPLEAVELMEGDGHQVHVEVENRAVLDSLLVAMNNDLTEDQRHVISLRFLDGFSLKETADIMDKKLNNIKVIQNRGIAKLRQVLKIKDVL